MASPTTLGPPALLAASFLALGTVAGATMHRSDYCLAGMFRDLFLFRSSRMLRPLALLVVSTMVLFEAARLAGVLPRYPFALLAPASAATLFGGLVFGVGMVLAGGCVVGTLYRVGAGSLPSAAALLGLVAGSGLYAELHPTWGAIAETGALPDVGATLPEALGLPPTVFVVATVAAFAPLSWRWHRRGLWVQASAARGFLQPWKASLLLALVGLASYLLAAMPLGITTCYAKMAAALESAIAPGRVEALAYFQTVPLDLELPLFGVRLRGGPGPGWDGIAAVQGMTIVGICLGAFVSSASLGEFRPTFRVPPRQFASALAGGILLALGSRFSSGCNVWYLLGGLPVFATQSLLFLGGMLPGAWLGGRVLTACVLVERPSRAGTSARGGEACESA